MPKKKPVTDEAIGALIREWRKKRGVSQPELGQALGISEQMVQRYETGGATLSVLKLVTIANTLKCKTTDLIP